MVVIRKCGKNVADDNVMDYGYNNIAEHGEDETEHGENITQVGENITQIVTKHMQKDDNHKHGENMESDKDQRVEYVERSHAFALEAKWNSSDNDSPISDKNEQYALATIAITTTTTTTTTSSRHSNPTIQQSITKHDISSNASLALRSHGFNTIATLLQISPELFLSSPQSTIFAIQDHSISNSSFPPWVIKSLLQYHTSPSNLSIKHLLNKPQGTCLPTLVPHKNIKITKIGPNPGSIEINNVLISHPDLFLQGPISIHGVIGPFLNINGVDQDLDFTKSPICRTNHSLASKITKPKKHKNVMIEWQRIVQLLSSNGFVSLAIGLHSVLDGIVQDYADLSSVTIFAPPHLAFVASSSPLLDRIVRFHIVRKRVSFSELGLLPKKAPLKTLVADKNLHITASFNLTKIVAINRVKINAPDIFSSRRFIIHGISRAFDVKGLLSASR
ncbi:hypothetical protein LguiB_029782 [Lonicera macranthoides]